MNNKPNEWEQNIIDNAVEYSIMEWRPLDKSTKTIVKTYEDVYGPSGMPDDKTFFQDYGQKYDTRQFFKHDFNKEVTKFMGGII